MVVDTVVWSYICMSRDLTALLSLAFHASGNERQLQEAYYSGNDLMQNGTSDLLC